MSDMPSGALVALICWLLWRPRAREAGSSFAAGLASGLSLLLREPLAVLLAPLLAGALLRRRVNGVALIAGGLLGISGRLILSHAFFGDPLYVRDSGIGFSVASLAHSIPVYGLILLVLYPGGAVVPFLYRGERRWEVVSAFAAYSAVILLYDYDLIGMQGPVKGIAIATRFMLPALPLLVWMAADVWPGVYRRTSAPIQHAIARALPLAVTALALVAFMIHPLARRQEREMVSIVRAIFGNTPDHGIVITNADATLKYLSGLYGPRRLLLRDRVDPDSLAGVAAQGPVSIVLLNRMDSEYFRADAAENDRYMAAVRGVCEVEQMYERNFGWALLQIAALPHCR